MSIFFKEIRQKIEGSPPSSDTSGSRLDRLIALGVLLWIVAEADDKFLPQEQDKIRDILKVHGKMADDDIPVVLQAVRTASAERIDMYTFTKEAAHALDRSSRIHILEYLFHVACADGDLDEGEHSTIRKIADLFRLDHKEFIDAKVRVKKAWGMDTAGL